MTDALHVPTPAAGCENVVELHRTITPATRIAAGQQPEPYTQAVFCNARHIVRVVANDSGGSTVTFADGEGFRFNETAETVARMMRGY